MLASAVRVDNDEPKDEAWRARRGRPSQCPKHAVGDDFLDLELQSGSTFPVKTLHKPTLTTWVRKSDSPGITDQHAFSEFLTHQIYVLGGAKAPSCCYYGQILGPNDAPEPGTSQPGYLLCSFVYGLRNLNEAGAAAVDDLSDYFVLTCILGNFDIKDSNILWLPDADIPIFIDDGAGLAKRADGTWKSTTWTVNCTHFHNRVAAWTREPWALWDFRLPDGAGGFLGTGNSFRWVTPDHVRRQVDHLASITSELSQTFPDEYADVRTVFLARLECTRLLAHDEQFNVMFYKPVPEVVPYVQKVCAKVLERVPMPPKRVQQAAPPATESAIAFELSGALREPLQQGTCELTKWGQHGVVVIPHDPHYAAEAFIELVSCAKKLQRPTGLDVWKLDERKVAEALTELFQESHRVSMVMNTWNLSSIVASHSYCQPYLQSGYTSKMLSFRDEVERTLREDMPDMGDFGARLIRPDAACAFHPKLWVVKDTVAAVVTYNAGKASPYVDFGVLIWNPDLVRSLYLLHRWDFECNAQIAPPLESKCSSNAPPVLHPAVIAGYQFGSHPLPDARAFYKTLIKSASVKITVVSPSFSEPSIASWLEQALQNVAVDIVTTWHYWGSKAAFNDQHDYNTRKIGKAGGRIVNMLGPTVHGKALLFHGPVNLPSGTPLEPYMQTCKCPFLITSANIYPGMWRSRELGVVLCDCDQWTEIYNHIWSCRAVNENAWKEYVLRIAKGSESTPDPVKLFRAMDTNKNGHLSEDDFHGLHGHFDSHMLTADVDGDGVVSEEEFRATWLGLAPRRQP